MGYINLPVENSGGGGVWGTITGTLSDQTDLQNALNAKDTILDPSVNPDLYNIYQTDFINGSGALGFNVNSSGAGSGTQVSTFGLNTTENAIGVTESSTGTTTTGTANFLGTQNQLRVASHSLDFGWRLALSALSDGTNTYTQYVGFYDNIGAGDMTNGAYFRYTHGTNGGRWECVTASAGSRTAVDSGVAASSATFDIFHIFINQAGTSFQFYINGTLVHTATTGFLPASTVQFGWGAKIEKSAGTTARLFYSDWAYLKILRSTAR